MRAAFGEWALAHPKFEVRVADLEFMLLLQRHERERVQIYTTGVAGGFQGAKASSKAKLFDCLLISRPWKTIQAFERESIFGGLSGFEIASFRGLKPRKLANSFLGFL
jgi:hypothetical protein